jgi:platelet-activating factor acetylhydrolase isoform II
MKLKNLSLFPLSRRSARLRIGGLMLLAVALVTTSAWLRANANSAAAFVEQTTAGQEQFTVSDLEWTDTGRARRVPARLFWPESASTGKVPLIVFSHGIGSSRDGYSYLGRYWASHGIASLHLQHVGSDRALWHGNVFSLVARFQQAAGDQEAIARVQDFSFALDRLLQSGRGAHVARDRIVAAGHSYGANTTLLAAGAKVVRDGRLLQFRDPRISAAIVISAPPFYGEKDFAPILSGIGIPTLHITTADDVIRIPGFGSGLEDRLRIFDATGGPFKALAVYKQGSHNVFTERRYFDSLEVATEIKTATEGLSLAFLDQVFGKTDTLELWERKHRALFSEYVEHR